MFRIISTQQIHNIVMRLLFALQNPNQRLQSSEVIFHKRCLKRVPGKPIDTKTFIINYNLLRSPKIFKT